MRLRTRQSDIRHSNFSFSCRKLAVIAVALFVSLPSQAFESRSYLGIPFGTLDASATSRVNVLFGTLPSGDSKQCLRNKEFATIFHFFHDSTTNLISLQDIVLSKNVPNSNCPLSKDALQGFASIKPGMFSFELISELTAKGFGKAYANKERAVFRKDSFDEPSCHKQAATDFFPEKFLFGSKRYSTHYTISDVKSSEVGSIKKEISVGYLEDPNRECNANNFPL